MHGSVSVSPLGCQIGNRNALCPRGSGKRLQAPRRAQRERGRRIPDHVSSDSFRNCGQKCNTRSTAGALTRCTSSAGPSSWSRRSSSATQSWGAKRLPCRARSPSRQYAPSICRHSVIWQTGVPAGQQIGHPLRKQPSSLHPLSNHKAQQTRRRHNVSLPESKIELHFLFQIESSDELRAESRRSKRILHIAFRVNALFLGALYPSKSGLMNKHIVKHILQG